VVPPNTLAEVWQLIRRNELSPERLRTLKASSPLGRILAAGLANAHAGRDVMKESIEEAASHVIHDLERYLNSLGTIAAIEPLLGLLGTVLGMIQVFSDVMLTAPATRTAGRRHLEGLDHHRGRAHRRDSRADACTAISCAASTPSWSDWSRRRSSWSTPCTVAVRLTCARRPHVKFRRKQRVEVGLDIHAADRRGVFLMLIFFMVSNDLHARGAPADQPARGRRHAGGRPEGAPRADRRGFRSYAAERQGAW